MRAAMGAEAEAAVGRVTEPRRLLLLVVLAVVLGLVSWGAAAWTLFGSVTAIWPTNALGVLAVLRGPRARGWALGVGLAVFAAVAGSVFLIGGPWFIAASMGAGNMLEVLLAVWLLRRGGLIGADLTQPGPLFGFLTRAAVIAPAITAVVMVPIVTLVSMTTPLQAFWECFSADALGMIILAPFGLALTREQLRRLRRPADAAVAIGLLAMIAAACVWIYRDEAAPHIGLLGPIAVFATLRFGALGAAGATLWIGTVAMVLNLNGWTDTPDLRRALFELQVGLAMLPLTTLPVAAVMNQLRQARRDAEAASLAKSAFLANMSHEIRTPLNGVIGMADLLAGGRLEPRERELVETIRASSSSLQRLLSDILDLARVESGKLEVEREPFHLGETVRGAAALARLDAEAKGLWLEVEIDPAVDAAFFGDAVRVRQILTNLTANAVKFTAVGGVRVTAAGTAEGVRLQVIDTGPGLNAAQLAKVFGRFEQADGSITRRYGGAGLGLAISQQLAGLMGGRLGADSVPARGSTFWVELPLEAAPQPAAAPVAVAPVAPAESGALRVLAVDDHPTNRRLVELLLEGAGAQVVSAEDGAQALVAFQAEAFDLVLMDMQMPVMDGLSAVRAIRAWEAERGLRRTPVLMLSANALPEHQAAGRAAGADGHLSKPIGAADLYAAIEAALAGQAQAA